MARPIVLSNGSMHVGINLYGMVHDLYYPYVGLENHAAASKRRHHCAICSSPQSTLSRTPSNTAGHRQHRQQGSQTSSISQTRTPGTKVRSANCTHSWQPTRSLPAGQAAPSMPTTSSPTSEARQRSSCPATARSAPPDV